MAAPTPEELQAQRQRRHAETLRLRQRANDLIAEIRTGDDWRAWLELGARFAGHGLRNALLIPDQRPEATHVADYDTWLARGRHVRRGERGIRILNSDAPASVFDIGQTSGQPWEPSRPGPDAKDLWPILKQIAQRHGQVAHLHGPVDDDAVMGLVHELSHVLLGTATQPCHGARHLEAESITFLIARHVGCDTSRFSFPDVRSWAGGQSETRTGIIRAFAARIDETAARIRAHLDRHLPAAPPATRTQPPAPRAEPRPEPPVPTPELLALHQLAHHYYLGRMRHGWAPRYLTGRGFPPAVQHQWGIGWVPPGWHNLLEHLRTHGYDDELIEAAGLARRTKHGNLIDVFRDRIMLPVHTPDGSIVAFIGRAAPNASSPTPKYLNSPETAIYKKSDHLIGLHEALPRLERAAQPAVVEGAFDAIAVTMASDRYAPVAPSGTALTEQQCRLLAEHSPYLGRTGVAVALDGDAAGRRAAVKAYDRLTPITYELTAIEFPPRTDPASILHDRSPDDLATLLSTGQRPLIDLVIDHRIDGWHPRLDTAEGQVAALRAVAPIIAALPAHQIARRVAHLSRRLGITHAEATQAVADAASPPPSVRLDRAETPPDLTAPAETPKEPPREAQTPTSRQRRR